MFSRRKWLIAGFVLAAAAAGPAFAGEQQQQAELTNTSSLEQAAALLATGSAFGALQAVFDSDVSQMIAGKLREYVPVAERHQNGEQRSAAPAQQGGLPVDAVGRGGDDPSGPWP